MSVQLIKRRRYFRKLFRLGRVDIGIVTDSSAGDGDGLNSVVEWGPEILLSTDISSRGASSRVVSFSSSIKYARDSAELRSTCAKCHCTSAASLAKVYRDRGDGEGVIDVREILASPEEEGNVGRKNVDRDLGDKQETRVFNCALVLRTAVRVDTVKRRRQYYSFIF